MTRTFLFSLFFAMFLVACSESNTTTTNNDAASDPVETEDNGATGDDGSSDGPVEDQPVDEDPVEEDPVEEDPVEEDPVEEEPAEEEPVEEEPVVVVTPPIMVGLLPSQDQILRIAGDDRYRFTFNTTSDDGVAEYRVSVVNDTTGQPTGYTAQVPVGITNPLETYTVERLLVLTPGNEYRWAVFAHDANGTQLSRSDYVYFTIKSDAPEVPPRFSEVLPSGTAFTSAVVDILDDPSYGPDLAIDGFIDVESTWSGDRDSVITFDIGSIQAVAGFYLYMNDLRNHWVKIETSLDGETWFPEFGGITTTSQSHYLSDFVLSGIPARFIRVTGFGSEVNKWTNIREAKWRSAGDPVAGEQIRHVRSGSSSKGFTSMNRDTRYDRFNEFVLEGLAYSFECLAPKPFGGVADVTGDRDYGFWRRYDDRSFFLTLDWDNYDDRNNYTMESVIRVAQGYTYPMCTNTNIDEWLARIPAINIEFRALAAQKRFETTAAQ